MSEFKRSVAISGKYKALSIVDGAFVDAESGEIIDIISQLEKIYGDNTFSLSTACKSDTELDWVVIDNGI